MRRQTTTLSSHLPSHSVQSNRFGSAHDNTRPWSLANHRRRFLPGFLVWMFKSPSPALLSFSLATLAVITIAVSSEMAFVSSVTPVAGTDTGCGQRVSLPLDRPSEGPFLIPIDHFTSTQVDRFGMPLLFAVMVVAASAVLVHSIAVGSVV